MYRPLVDAWSERHGDFQLEQEKETFMADSDVAVVSFSVARRGTCHDARAGSSGLLQIKPDQDLPHMNFIPVETVFGTWRQRIGVGL